MELRKEIDECLHKINSLRAQYIGTDTTKDEYEMLSVMIHPYKQRIKELDSEYYYTLYPIYPIVD